jgi:hypothetical protein
MISASHKNLQTPFSLGLFMVNQRTVDEVLSSLQPNEKETTQQIRELIQRTVPETVEFVRNGKITYRLGDRDFVWISHYQSHVDLEFAMGASLDSDLLRTRGVNEKNENVRHISVANFSRLQPELSKLLEQAATLGFEHCPKT